jgi:hypothetical protein
MVVSALSDATKNQNLLRVHPDQQRIQCPLQDFERSYDSNVRDNSGGLNLA